MNRGPTLTLLLLALMIAGVLVISGCATTAPYAAPPAVLVAAPLPCPAAQGAPDAPPRNLDLDASRPGEAVKAYAGNRQRWISYADALREKLDACK